MEFVQKRMANNIRFEFTPDELKFWIRDNSGERDLTIDYSRLPRTTRRVFERNAWIRNVGALWCALGALSVGLALAGSRLGAGSFTWLILGIACIGFYRLTQTNYTVLDTDAGSIWVMEDKQSATILGEIQARRKSRLLALYGEFNPNNDRQREIEKYNWLVSEHAMTREEADRKISRLGQANIIDSPSQLLN